jgi:beta-glucanase (GH16 family)
MKNSVIIISLFAICISGSCQKEQEPATPIVVPPNNSGGNDPKINYKLLWSDEFNVEGLPDERIWGYDVGGDGWGNQELQHYTQNRKENARIEKGNLIIEAIKEEYKGNKYTSARLVTRDKKPILYGKVEVSAKLPKGIGSWPAIWTLGQNIKTAGWPTCGEIDIMEHVGFDPNVVHNTIHTKAYNHSIGTQKSTKKLIDNVFDNYHKYGIEWTPTKIDFFIDDIKTYTFSKETGADVNKFPFTEPQYLLLNIAVGGAWGGQKGIDDSIFPIKMYVDYVRVYEEVK